MNSLFRNARKNEAEAIFTLYKAVIGTPYCTWDEVYPGLLEIRHDLEAGNLFVLETDGRIIGAISIVPENELDNLNCWNFREKAGEFARVVIHPDFQGKSLSHVLVSNILDEMKRRGYENIHISVAMQNVPAQKTYLHFGFSVAGQEELWGHSFYLFELKI